MRAARGTLQVFIIKPWRPGNEPRGYAYLATDDGGTLEHFCDLECFIATREAEGYRFISAHPDVDTGAFVGILEPA